jgi:tetratricopeptide (TPR) repeat protein
MYALLEMYLSFNSFNGSIAEFGNSQPKNLPQLSDIEFKNLNITTIESLLKQCTARDPSFTYGWYNLALIYSEKSLYNYAIEAYGRAIKTNPNFAEAFYNRGLTYLNTDNTRKACNDLSKAGELGLPEAYEVIKQYCK